ncbi:hypothetical protein K6U06_06625 [Acidiferrimicrobium sp. IK]|uniref:hypothetical protein n=1 Tax=Acidiferrimicrobium sp. IK TaxID=2871700 RepID=UPI0021CB79F7|nr:hypothetical protein [Acidiferrimicrobium sp. IK]MCU4184028.1 hypothetical protein [Acidiferrimicrobium sp. IK]
MPVELIGFRELLGELATAKGKSRRSVATGLAVAAKTIADKANQYAPRGKTGNLSANGRPYYTTISAGVAYTLIYAPVQEFAVDWTRRSRGHGGGPATRGEKKARANGAGGAGTNEVHYTKLGSPPRFAWRALQELQDGLILDVYDQVIGDLRCNGWFNR